MPVNRWYAERAWLGEDSGIVDHLVIATEEGRIVTVDTGVDTPPPDATALPGMVLPGLVNAHSHAFHRALRGRTHTGAGDFWSWRERMYALADRLDPDSYLALARAAYAEMALAGITTVAEFHYLHHGPDGQPYDEPNAMGDALVVAAGQAGIRLVLLDTCYLQSDVDGRPLSGTQRRFGDGSADAWAARVESLAAPHVGAAIHSVRGCPPDAMRLVADVAAAHGAVLHIHLSEQRSENEACLATHGRTPAQLCGDTGVLGDRTTAVHATHVTGDDIRLIGGTGTGVCLCPTTERDLADGVGLASALAGAGAMLSVGSDGHAVVDLFEEARAVELDERLVTGQRGRHDPAALLTAATAGGARAAGIDAGRLAPGATADFIAVRLNSVRLAGAVDADPVAGLVFAATAADVSHVVAGGRLVVDDGVHRLVDDVPRALAEAIRSCVPP